MTGKDKEVSLKGKCNHKLNLKGINVTIIVKKLKKCKLMVMAEDKCKR